MLDNILTSYPTMSNRQVWAEYQRIQNNATEYERKNVYRIVCRDCHFVLTDRGMNAVLLSDRNIELYSTDLFPDSIGLVEGDYSAVACTCRVRDTACIQCGNIVGYHVNVPCKICLLQPNNGHFWMFRSVSVHAKPIFMQLTKCRDLPLMWGFVHSSGEFEGRYFKSGDALAAHESCRLSVKLTSNIPLIVRFPYTQRVMARMKNGDVPEIFFCR
ncbi:FAM72 protein-domain-containing protein [Cunninghamella echinulata]|nr:FAM72 protein-domain-containing protein [Cunninghamella echinulata]